MANDDLVEVGHEGRFWGIVASIGIIVLSLCLLGYVVYKFTRRKLSHSLQQLQLCLGTIDRLDRELSQLRAELRAVGAPGHGAAGPGGMGVGRYGV